MDERAALVAAASGDRDSLAVLGDLYDERADPRASYIQALVSGGRKPARPLWKAFREAGGGLAPWIRTESARYRNGVLVHAELRDAHQLPESTPTEPEWGAIESLRLGHGIPWALLEQVKIERYRARTPSQLRALMCRGNIDGRVLEGPWAGRLAGPVRRDLQAVVVTRGSTETLLAQVPDFVDVSWRFGACPFCTQLLPRRARRCRNCRARATFRTSSDGCEAPVWSKAGIQLCGRCGNSVH